MRTTIDIDDALISEAMALSGAKTNREAVHEALTFFVRLKNASKSLRQLKGKIAWDGDLDAMRRADAPPR